MAAGHLDNSAIAIWFQPDIDFSNQEKIVGGCRSRSAVSAKWFRTSSSAKQLNPLGV
jgi:hypothetical protein